MTPHEEGRAAAAKRRSAWDNPYPTGSDDAKAWDTPETKARIAAAG